MSATDFVTGKQGQKPYQAEELDMARRRRVDVAQEKKVEVLEFLENDIRLSGALHDFQAYALSY